MEKFVKLCNSKEIAFAARDAADFAYCIGMVMRAPQNKSSSQLVSHLPFTLFPSPVPRHLFQQAIGAQQDFNQLMHAVAQDVKFIEDSYKSVLENDDFTRKLFEIHKTTLATSNTNKLQMALLRSDYMFDVTDSENTKIKQIEINMIASSFGGCAERVTKLHRNLLQKLGLNGNIDIPKNTVLHDLAESLSNAWSAYDNESAKILIIVTSEEQNIFDQRHLELAIMDINPKIIVIRKTLQEVHLQGRLGSENQLLIKEEEISIVYYRAGYIPDSYPTDKEWSARQLLDSSNAINCPSAGYQLVGAKKMQQVLAQDGAVERFIKDKESVERIRNTFAGLYTLDMTLEGDEHVKMAMNNPEKYVLKPQLEGGGNNLYGDDIVLMLTDIGSDSRRCSYILMNRIKPMPFQTALVINTACHLVEGVSELGVFGYILSKGSELLANKQCGHLLRTKASHHNDGGVASGVAVLDTPALTNSNTTRECC